MRRSVLPVVVVALALIIGLSFVAGRMMGRGGEAVSTPSPSATATAEPTTSDAPPAQQTPDEVEEQLDAITAVVRTFVSEYYGHVPGATWADVRGKVKSVTSARFLAASRPDDYLPIDDLELDRELRYDAEAVLDTMVTEYESLEFGPIDVSTSLGVTSYTADDQLDSYTQLNRVLVVQLRRSGTDAWVVDDISFIE